MTDDPAQEIGGAHGSTSGAPRSIAACASIEVGKRADLIILDRNLFRIPVAEIPKTRVLMTMVDGRQIVPYKP